MLTPEQVNEFIAKAVMDSQIGAVVQESVQRVMADLRKSYNNPFDEVIKRHVVAAIDREIESKYRDEIGEGVKVALATMITADFVSEIVSAAVAKMRGSRY
jgi:hypothetical protein